MQVTVKQVTTENVIKGKNSYSVATVVYENGRGETKEKKLMSFSNPQVFAAIGKAKSGDTFEVTLGGAPYYNWEGVTSGAAAADAGAPLKKAAYTSNYETPDERKMRQLMIVRQSSIANAIATLAPGSKVALDPKEVLAIAQTYVEFVYDEDLGEVDTENEDIPY